MVIAGKLYMVLYMAGHISGVAGPLPYDKVECEARATAMKTEWATQLATGYDTEGVAISPERKAFYQTWDAKCEEHDVRPTIYEGPFYTPSTWTLIKEWFRG